MLRQINGDGHLPRVQIAAAPLLERNLCRPTVIEVHQGGTDAHIAHFGLALGSFA